MRKWERRRGRGHFLGTPVEWAYTRLSPTYYRSRRRARRDDTDYSGLAAFCLFVGHERSGHTLVGALLNAHPNVVIAHEVDALQFIAAGFTREQLYRLIRDQDREFVAAGASWTGYDYSVPGQWQGRSQELRVIGDKHGHDTVTRLARKPQLLDRLQATVAVPVRMVHVVRDPQDNIVTMMRRGGRTLEKAVQDYFAHCETLAALHETHPGDLHVVHLEDMVADPERSLTALAGFLGVEVAGDYVEACAAIVFDAPRRTRDTVEWPDGASAAVRAESARYPWLARYLV